MNDFNPSSQKTQRIWANWKNDPNNDWERYVFPNPPHGASSGLN